MVHGLLGLQSAWHIYIFFVSASPKIPCGEVQVAAVTYFVFLALLLLTGHVLHPPTVFVPSSP